MLSKPNRLTKKKDFDVVFEKGQTAKAVFLIAKILKTNSLHSRFGFVVSKKVSTKATVRNKLKRRLRDSVALALKNQPAHQKQADVVMVALPVAAQKEFLEIKSAVNNIFLILNK